MKKVDWSVRYMLLRIIAVAIALPIATIVWFGLLKISLIILGY